MYAVYISFFKKQMIGGTKFVGFENYARLLGWPVLEQCWSCGPVHVRAGADHAVPVGFDGPGVGFDEAAMARGFFRISTFLPYAVPAVVSTLIWGFVYGAK